MEKEFGWGVEVEDMGLIMINLGWFVIRQKKKKKRDLADLKWLLRRLFGYLYTWLRRKALK